jgi:formate/nitrite transporter FocA (FNT family)
MKKSFVFMLLAVVFVLASCSKESKLNRKLDGTWNLSKINGAALSSGFSQKITFTKDKKAGTYSVSGTVLGVPFSDAGTYTLEADTKLTMTSNAAGATASTVTIVSYSKTDMTAKDGDDTYEYTKE